MTTSRHDYSTLEVFRDVRSEDFDTNKIPGFARVEEKQLVIPTGLEPQSREESEYFPNRSHAPWKRKTWWILPAVIAALLVIIGASVGGVLASRKTSSDASTPGNSTSSNPTSSNSTSSNLTPLNSTSSNSSATFSSKIATVGYLDSGSNVTRLYYQDNTGQIVEWSRVGTKSWTGPSPLGFVAKAGSPIAASTARPGYTFVSFRSLTCTLVALTGHSASVSTTLMKKMSSTTSISTPRLAVGLKVRSVALAILLRRTRVWQQCTTTAPCVQTTWW